MQKSKYFLWGLFVIFFFSCGIKSHRTFEVGKDNLAISDSDIICTFGQFITDYFRPLIYLKFTSKSEAESEVLYLDAKINYEQGGHSTPTSFRPKSIKVGTLMDNKPVNDSSFKSIMEIPGESKSFSGKSEPLLLTIEFEDVNRNDIFRNAEKLFIALNIEIKTNGGVKKYNKTIELKSTGHYHIWFLRDD